MRSPNSVALAHGELCVSFAGLRVLLLPSGRRGKPGTYAARRKRRLALFGMADAGRWALVRRPALGAPARNDEPRWWN